MSELTDKELAEMVRILEGTKILDEPPSGNGFHVCSPNPVLGMSNYEYKCHFCGVTIYASSDMPLYKKICMKCTVEKANGKPVSSFITTSALSKFVNHGQRN